MTADQTEAELKTILSEPQMGPVMSYSDGKFSLIEVDTDPYGVLTEKNLASGKTIQDLMNKYKAREK